MKRESFGNYLEFDIRLGQHYHKDALNLNSGRYCLYYIIKAKQYKKLFIPYYTCKTILDIVNKCNIQYEFYTINELLEPVQEYQLSIDEAFLYTNYFGLKQETVIKLASVYQSQLIVDNTLAFYAKSIKGIDTFYSARKFFGVPDGAYLYTNTIWENEVFEQSISYDRLSHLFKRIDLSIEEGRADHQNNEQKLDEDPIKLMSKLTDKLLMGIDYEAIKNKRIENYLFLDEFLKNENLLKINYSKDSVPMIYPFLSKVNDLRERLVKNKIYTMIYWGNVLEWCSNDKTEYFLAKNIIALPVVQTYDKENMSQIIEILQKCL